MEDKNSNLGNVQNTNESVTNTESTKVKKEKKKNVGVKIVVIIIILIMALIIGLLSWMLASGNDFSTIIDNISSSFENKKDKKSESKEDDNGSENNKSNNSGNNQNENTDINNNGKNGNVSGRGGDVVDFDGNFSKLTKTKNAPEKFRLVYLTNGIRNITVGGASFVCNEDDPHITGINTNVAQKIEDYVKNYYTGTWSTINAQTQDDYITEILTNMNEASLKNPDYNYDDIGFNQSCRDIFLSTKVLTIKLTLTGDIGGVGWDSSTGVSFEIGNGSVIKIQDIVTSKDEYIAACKKYAMEQLKQDDRYSEVLEMHKNDYESIIYEAIEKMDGYFVRDGIVCAEIPKYSIASGASGEFKFIVPYSAIKDYIDAKYLDDIDLTGESYRNKSDNTYTQNTYTTEQLSTMALDYYEAKTGHRPTGFYLFVQSDGNVSIQMYDNMGDHNSTCDWYIVDPNTATGEDMMQNNIDLKVKPAREY